MAGQPNDTSSILAAIQQDKPYITINHLAIQPCNSLMPHNHPRIMIYRLKNVPGVLFQDIDKFC